MSGRYVEMAVCESCGRVFHQASMRGRLCMSCAAKAAPRESAEPPAGYGWRVCRDCGARFAAPAGGMGRPRKDCWKCGESRRKAANRAALRRLRARRAAAN